MDSDGVSSPSLEVAPQFTMKLDRGNTVTDTVRQVNLFLDFWY